MEPDRWQRVQTLFLALADQSPGEQAELLAAQCGGDDQLFTEIHSLLLSDRESGEALEAVIASEVILWDRNASLAGERLGAWRVIREIGRGGMGSVYLAVRDDDHFQKQVAVKVVRRGMDTSDVLERFRAERQILANLDHPYIARLIDGGTTPDGRPFFVMDYVEGQPLDLYCSANGLGIVARCRLFLRILEAVAHAHRNLVIHRDLKPANIFVKSDGSPKLLDFGVAKLLDMHDPGSGSTSIARPFTPEYASPEQVWGTNITTAVDIYSLGAILFEILTGRRAQPTGSLTPSEIERAVCQTEVKRPSLLAPEIDSDLDNIVLMAMRKDPARRYQSVDRLADDMQSYLDGKPISARKDSFWYRSRKFIGRYRFPTSMAAVFLIFLIVALVMTLAEARIARSERLVAEAQRSLSDRERRHANRERVRAEAGFHEAERARAEEERQRINAERQRLSAERRLTELLNIADKTLFEIHDAVARLPGAVDARRVIVKNTLAYLQTIERENEPTDRLRLSLGAAYSRIAAVEGDTQQASLGDFNGAKANYEKAERLLRPLYLRQDSRPDVVMRWLEVEMGLAGLSVAQSGEKPGVEMYMRLLPAAQKLALLAPNNPLAAKPEANLEGAISLAIQGSDPRGALDHANRQIAILTNLVERFPANRDLEEDLGSALAAAAGPLKNLGNLEEAAKYFDKSLRVRERFLEQEPHNAHVQRNLLVVYGNYCALLGVPWSVNMGRPAEARVYCEKSVAIARELSNADPQDSTARYDVGVSLSQLGMIDPEPNQVLDSLKCLDSALEILDPIIKSAPDSAKFVNRAALVREYSGLRLQMLGRTTEASERFRKTIAELEVMANAHPGPTSPTELESEGSLAEIYASRGESTLALELAERAVDQAEKASSFRSGRASSIGHLGEAYFELAWVERQLGDREHATVHTERARSLWRSIDSDKGILSVHRKALKRTDELMTELAAAKAQ